MHYTVFFCNDYFLLISCMSFATTFSIHCRYLFHDGGRYHIETSPLICGANHWTGFYMITVSVMKELNLDSWTYKVK